MKYGCCVPAALAHGRKLHETTELLAGLERAGFGFAELPIGLLAGAEEEAIEAVRRQPLPVPIYHGLPPDDLPLAGPGADDGRLAAYAAEALSRVSAAGGRLVLIDGGLARTVPEGTSKEAGMSALERFLQACEEPAAAGGILVAVMPLSRKTANVIRRLEDAVELAARLYLPHLRVAADSGHMRAEREEADMLEEAADLGLLAHVHLTDVDRGFPGRTVDRGVDYAHFLGALRDTGYAGALSLAGHSADAQTFVREAAESLAFVKRVWSEPAK